AATSELSVSGRPTAAVTIETEDKTKPANRHPRSTATPGSGLGNSDPDTVEFDWPLTLPSPRVVAPEEWTAQGEGMPYATLGTIETFRFRMLIVDLSEAR